MSITREKKSQTLEKLKTAIDKSKTIVFVNFRGLTVADATILRRELKQSGVNYLVSKKSLVRRALGESKISGEMPDMVGEVSLAYGEDLLEPARKVYSFEKKLKDKISIYGGVFEGKYLGKLEMIEIAQIPSKETLYAQFVNVINSPIQGLVVALEQIAKSKSA